MAYTDRRSHPWGSTQVYPWTGLNKHCFRCDGISNSKKTPISRVLQFRALFGGMNSSQGILIALLLDILFIHKEFPWNRAKEIRREGMKREMSKPPRGGRLSFSDSDAGSPLQ